MDTMMDKPKQKDTTMATKPQKKMGRPTVGTRAMTNRERQQRWRDRVKAEAQALLQQVGEIK